ncbi:MAG: phosphofructokinase domain-containing protein [Monoraphidium minutum]|nr:MAG: phosphofructokinase domain-containing protein [Monoraphidium minutum]
MLLMQGSGRAFAPVGCGAAPRKGAIPVGLAGARRTRTRSNFKNGGKDAPLSAPALVEHVPAPPTGAHPADTLQVETLREFLQPRPSPFTKDNNAGAGFVGDRDRIRMHTAVYESDKVTGLKAPRAVMEALQEDGTGYEGVPEWAIRSGPRETIYFDPREVTAAIVTCDGLCPGVNDVVQNMVFTLADYGVPEDQILGIKYGLRGFYDKDSKPVTLTRRAVDGIHLKGGTMLGTSRGGGDAAEIVRRIDLWGVNMLYIVGGNGGNKAAAAIQEEIKRQGVLCTVASVPKSIDNDILLIDKCFGFDTAVAEAHRALLAAKVEAVSGCRGVGLVRLMGRNSGFIAMQASMASGVVDVCLIPEMGPISMDKLLAHTSAILDRKGHCVVCVAEGVGQEGAGGIDKQGYAILKDIGLVLRDVFKARFKDQADIKYIDPSYLIRATPPSSSDRIYCKVLGQGAVHASFAAYTGFSVSQLKTHYVLLPTRSLNKGFRAVNIHGRTWTRLKTAIQQPDLSL